MMLPIVFLCVGIGKPQISSVPLPNMSCVQHEHAADYEDLPVGKYFSTLSGSDEFMVIQDVATGKQYIVDVVKPAAKPSPTPEPEQTLMLPTRVVR